MKDIPDNKVPLVRMSQNDPGGQREQQPGGVQHDQGEVYQKPKTFSRVSQSGQVEIKIGYLYCQFLYPKPKTYNLVYGA